MFLFRSFLVGLFFVSLQHGVFASELVDAMQQGWNIRSVKAAYQQRKIDRDHYKKVVEELEQDYYSSKQKAREEFDSGAISEKEYWRKLYDSRVKYWGGSGTKSYEQSDLRDTEVIHTKKIKKVIVDDRNKSRDNSFAIRKSPPTQENSSSILKSKLVELKELLDEGFINQSEYDAKKQQLLKDFH